MRRLIAPIATLSLLAFGAGAAAGARGAPPPFPRLPGQWSHAEINVTIKKQPHTLILDRGRIIQVGQQQLVLHRADGTNVSIPLAPETIVTPLRYALFPATLRKGLYAETMIIDGGPAVRVKVSLRP